MDSESTEQIVDTPQAQRAPTEVALQLQFEAQARFDAMQAIYRVGALAAANFPDQIKPLIFECQTMAEGAHALAMSGQADEVQGTLRRLREIESVIESLRFLAASRLEGQQQTPEAVAHAYREAMAAMKAFEEDWSVVSAPFMAEGDFERVDPTRVRNRPDLEAVRRWAGEEARTQFQTMVLDEAAIRELMGEAAVYRDDQFIEPADEDFMAGAIARPASSPSRPLPKLPTLIPSRVGRDEVPGVVAAFASEKRRSTLVTHPTTGELVPLPQLPKVGGEVVAPNSLNSSPAFNRAVSAFLGNGGWRDPDAEVDTI
ncbi:hypothetical protein KBD59_02180 [Candidatus Gracilibacteria bacterium]|nr:hypothetical protein [Candidatus Gracilibacteria bacterium]